MAGGGQHSREKSKNSKTLQIQESETSRYIGGGQKKSVHIRLGDGYSCAGEGWWPLTPGERFLFLEQMCSCQIGSVH